MLIINGESITYSEHPVLVKALGHCHRRNELTDDYIEMLIVNEEYTYEYDNINELLREVAKLGTIGSLPIRFTYPALSNSCEIIMTGSRADDFRVANEMIGRRSTPGGYTWHHVENIRYKNGDYYCKMILIDTKYHSRIRHYGGVQEYERLTGKKYR